jgi:hypothetical protein
MTLSSCARQRTRSLTLIVSESLFPIRSHRKSWYSLKVSLRVFKKKGNYEITRLSFLEKREKNEDQSMLRNGIVI